MLSNSELLKALTLINFYEYSFGLISGIVVNYLYETFIPFVKNESMIKSVPLLFILIIPLISFFVYQIRIYIDNCRFPLGKLYFSIEMLICYGKIMCFLVFYGGLSY